MKALLLGYYGAKNLGDDMMLHCILQWLTIQGMSVTVVSEDPAETTKRFSVSVIRNTSLLFEWGWWDSWFRGHALRLIRAIRSHDLLVVGGGDLIRDDKGWRTFWYTIEKMVLALLLGKKVYMLNIGIVGPSTAIGRVVLRYVLNKCSKVIVRDQSSFETCLKLGNKERSMMKPDIVLSLPTFLNAEYPVGVEENNKYILVCLRMEPNDFGTYPYGDEQLDALASALDEVSITTGAIIVFIPFQHDRSNDDNIIHKNIIGRMRQGKMTKLEEWSSDLLKLSVLFRDASCIVAMRLHAAVLGVALGRPVVVMPYDRKVTEFADLVGIKSRLENRNSSNANFIKELICNKIRRGADVYNLEAINDWEKVSLIK